LVAIEGLELGIELFKQQRDGSIHVADSARKHPREEVAGDHFGTRPKVISGPWLSNFDQQLRRQRLIQLRVSENN